MRQTDYYLAWGAKKLDESRQKTKSNPRQKVSNPANMVQLPRWSNSVRGLPNVILRTALFAAIKRGKRRYMEREVMSSVKGVEILYTGQQLNQGDLDVWEGALHVARLQPLGNKIEFTEKGFLKMIGRGGESGHSIGKSDREWLRKTFARLSASTIKVINGQFIYEGSLIDEYFRNEYSGRYVLVLNTGINDLFQCDGWTQFDWDIRRSLRGHPLAQWLHLYYSSHAKPYALKIETLHRFCGSATGINAKTQAEWNKALLGWRDDSLIPSFNFLAVILNQVEQTFSWELSNGLIHISRTPSSSQKEHLRKKHYHNSSLSPVNLRRTKSKSIWGDRT